MTQEAGGETTGGGSGLTPNIASLLCYLLMAVTCGAPVVGVVFLVIEKTDADIRFHAWQSIVLGVTLWGANLVLTGLAVMIPLLGFVFRLGSLVLSLSGLTVWVICMIKAYQNERWKIPFVGDIAAKQAKV